MEQFEAHPKSLKYLLSMINERELALPDFQRDFVWDPRATEELIESIARSYPAGSLLFMPFKPDTFAPRAVQGAPDLDGSTPAELVLDGQQRLTSLYQACYGVGDYRYFLALRPLIEGDDIEEAVFYRNKNRAGRYETVKQQAEELVLPLGVLFGERGGFHRWRDNVLEELSTDGNDMRAMRDQLEEAYEEYIFPIEDYDFPVVSLAHKTSLEAVCSIFETLNRTGVRLSVFELLAARFYAKGLDLRKLWEDARQERAIIEDYRVDEYYVLQSLALRARGSARRSDVLRLTVEDVHEHWDTVMNGFRQALEMLRDQCGVLTAKWLPYGYLLVPMAAAWKEAIEVAGPRSGANRERIKRWFWCSALSGSYDRAANTQAQKDFTELSRWASDGDAPEVVREFRLDRSQLREITPKQQSRYKGLMTLVLRRGPVDFHHATPLTPDAMAAQGVDDHHVFPKAFLNPADQEPRYENQLVDCIMNRTLIDADTNRRIGKRAPSDYLEEIKSELSGEPGDAFKRLLESHMLPAGKKSPLLADDFSGFVGWREDEFAALVETATGTPVTDGEAVTDDAA